MPKAGTFRKAEIKSLGDGKIALVVSMSVLRNCLPQCLDHLSTRKVDQVWVTSRDKATHKIALVEEDRRVDRAEVGEIEL